MTQFLEPTYAEGVRSINPRGGGVKWVLVDMAQALVPNVWWVLD